MTRFLRKAISFLKIPLAEKLLFLLLLAKLYGYKIMVMCLPYRLYKSRFEQPSKKGSCESELELSGSEQAALRKILLTFRRCRPLIFWKKTYCLVNALAVTDLLKREGVGSSIHLGVKKDDAGYGAHAWVMVGGEIVLGGSEAAEFREISGFEQG